MEVQDKYQFSFCSGTMEQSSAAAKRNVDAYNEAHPSKVKFFGDMKRQNE